MALAFFNLIYGTIDVPILDFISGDDAVAWYAVAYRWVGIPVFIATAVVAAYFPRFSAHGKARSPEFAASRQPRRSGSSCSYPCRLRSAWRWSPTTCRHLLRPAVRADDPADPDPRPADPDRRHGHDPRHRADRRRPSEQATSSCRWPRPSSTRSPASSLIHWADRSYDNGAIGAAIVTFGTELFVMTGAMILQSKGSSTGRRRRLRAHRRRVVRAWCRVLLVGRTFRCRSR